MTTDETKQLVGFCEPCDEWYHLVDDSKNRNCRTHYCGSYPSSKIGFQLTTQRTFNPSTKKLSKAQIKKMSQNSA